MCLSSHKCYFPNFKHVLFYANKPTELICALKSYLAARPHGRLAVAPEVPGLELAAHVGGHQLTGPGEGHRRDGAALRLVIHLGSINQLEHGL